MPIAAIGGVIALVSSGIQLYQSCKSAFNNCDASSLPLGSAARSFTDAAQTVNQQLSSSTQERTEETADEKRRREQEQWQLDQDNRFNLQEQQFTPHEFFEPQETTFPT